jgi:crossover junction endodeoxyribonuclease RusA
VADIARANIPPNHSPVGSGRLKLIVVYFHERPTANIDNDNLVKPIQDALNGLVYKDDVLITDVDIRKKSLEGLYKVRGMSAVLANAFVAGQEFVCVRVEHAQDHGALL